MRGSVAIVLGLLMLSCSSDEGADDAGASTGGSATGGQTSGTGGQTSATGGSATGGEATGSGGASSGGASTGSGASNSGGTGAGGQPAATSGCGMSAPSGVQERVIQVGGVERSFVLSIPENYDPSQSYPLVFAWHGLGGDGALARLYFRVENEADGAALFVYPDGLPNEEGQAAWDLEPEGGDVALFDALLASLTAEYCVDAERVFSTGHSYGGFMTNRLGCSRGDVLRAVAPVAGGPPFGGGNAAECAGEVGAVVIHGTYDPTVDITQGQAAVTRYTEASACLTSSVDWEPAPCVLYDACAADQPVAYCEHDTPEEDAHNWPDFAAEGIWKFFSLFE